MHLFCLGWAADVPQVLQDLWTSVWVSSHSLCKNSLCYDAICASWLGSQYQAETISACPCYARKYTCTYVSCIYLMHFIAEFTSEWECMDLLLHNGDAGLLHIMHAPVFVRICGSLGCLPFDAYVWQQILFHYHVSDSEDLLLRHSAYISWGVAWGLKAMQNTTRLNVYRSETLFHSFISFQLFSRSSLMPHI